MKFQIPETFATRNLKQKILYTLLISNPVSKFTAHNLKMTKINTIIIFNQT